MLQNAPLKNSLIILKVSDLHTISSTILLEETITVRKTTIKNLIYSFGNKGKNYTEAEKPMSYISSCLNRLSPNSTKWSNTLKHFVCNRRRIV